MVDHSRVFGEREKKLKDLLNITEYFKTVTFRISLSNPKILNEDALLIKKLSENHEKYLLIQEFLDKDSKLYYGPNRLMESGLSCLEFCCNLSLKSLIELSSRVIKALKKFEVFNSECRFLNEVLFSNCCYHYKFTTMGNVLEINHPRDFLNFLHIVPHFMYYQKDWISDPELGLLSKRNFIDNMEIYLVKICSMLTIPTDLIVRVEDCHICERDRLMVGLLHRKTDHNCNCITTQFDYSDLKGGTYSEDTNAIIDQYDSFQRLICLTRTPCCLIHEQILKSNLQSFKKSKTLCHEFVKF